MCYALIASSRCHYICSAYTCFSMLLFLLQKCYFTIIIQDSLKLMQFIKKEKSSGFQMLDAWNSLSLSLSLMCVCACMCARVCVKLSLSHVCVCTHMTWDMTITTRLSALVHHLYMHFLCYLFPQELYDTLMSLLETLK